MKNLIRIMSVAMILASLSSCNKIVENQQKNLLISIMTHGQWHVEEYFEGVTIATTEFEGYNFQFSEDGSVVAIKGDKKIFGTWIGDVQNLSITSHFPDAEAPILKLEGLWKIVDTKMDFVEAEMSNETTKNLIRLRKNA